MLVVELVLRHWLLWVQLGATDWCYWLILWTVGGLAQGFSTFVSRAFGDRNYPEMNKTIAAAAELCFFIGLFFTVAGIATTKAVQPLLIYY